MLPESLKKYLENNDFDNFPISLMDIKYPILMSYEVNHEIHVLYITKFKRLKKQLDYITVKSSYEEIIDVLQKNKPLNHLFKNKEMNQRKVNRKHFSDTTKKLNYNELIEILPKDDFYLDQKYPNKIDLEEALDEIILQKNFFDKLLKEYDYIKEYDYTKKQNKKIKKSSFEIEINKNSSFLNSHINQSIKTQIDDDLKELEETLRLKQELINQINNLDEFIYTKNKIIHENHKSENSIYWKSDFAEEYQI